MEEDKMVYIIGHKNPDTDSICSAIAYAYLKNKTTSGRYEARRAGRINEETRFVLSHFKMDPPECLADVRTQVRDVDVDKLRGVKSNISIKKAWALMKKLDVVTLPILKEKKLEGLITTEDIATSYMDVYDSTVLAMARTQYKNILETLDGTILTGNAHGYFVKGKVLIGAGSPDLMEDYMEDDDLVILGNRYESQLCALEMKASCLVICDGAKVAGTIVKMAEERQCVIITTPHDTFSAARLINQSIPVKFFMRHKNLITFTMNDYVDDLKDTMAKKRYRNFPILDQGEYVGMISRRRLINNNRKQIILVDHNEKSQAVDGIDEAEILEVIDHHRLGSLETISPVFFRNQPVGCTATIMYQMYKEQGVEIPKKIAGLLCSAIISDTLLFRSPTCTDADKAAAEALAKIAGVEPVKMASEMFKAGSNLRRKKPEEIFHQDYKEFTVGDEKFGVGQINSMNADELEALKDKLVPYMETLLGANDGLMLFFMLTNILDESTELLCVGNGANALVEESFDQKVVDHAAVLKGVVSRKKQLIPAFIVGLQQ